MGEPVSTENKQNSSQDEGSSVVQQDGNSGGAEERGSSATLVTDWLEYVSILGEGSRNPVPNEVTCKAQAGQCYAEKDLLSTNNRAHHLADLVCPRYGLISICGSRQEMDLLYLLFPPWSSTLLFLLCGLYWRRLLFTTLECMMGKGGRR
jgi:hypothetical protein